jgi:putative endonuclease
MTGKTTATMRLWGCHSCGRKDDNKRSGTGGRYMKSYYVYLLASGKNGTLYVGVTSDLKRRVYEHKEGLAESFTRKHNVKTLVWYEHTNDVSAAITREKQLKGWKRSWKIELIEQDNREWQDLYEKI